MAFPSVAATNTSVMSTTGGTTSHTVNLPTGIASGNLLIIFFADSLGTGSTNTLSGWTPLTKIDATTTCGCQVFYRIADGTEGSTVTVTTTGTTKSAHNSYRITSWHGTTPPEQATTTGGADTHPDPPSLTASWGSADTLWLEAGIHGAAATFSAASANYTDLISAVSGGSGAAGSNAGVGTARRQLAAASDDPDNGMTISGSNTWAAITLAIRPVGGPTTTTLTGTKGTLSFSGASAVDKITQGATKGSLTLSGAAATMRQLIMLTASKGTLTISGDISLFKRTLPATKGSLTLSGDSATFHQIFHTAAAAGALTLSGGSASNREIIGAQKGALTLTGDAAIHKITIITAKGALTLTGSVATLRQIGITTLTADKGLLVLTGDTAIDKLTVVAANRALTLTGKDATLRQVAIMTLVADKGILTLSGVSAAFIESLIATKGTVVLTGNDVLFLEKLQALIGSLSLIGALADFVGGEVTIPQINDGDEVQVINAGGIECMVVTDSVTGVRVVITSEKQITVLTEHETQIMVTI